MSKKNKIIGNYRTDNRLKDFKSLFSDIETIIINSKHEPVIICLLDEEDEYYIFESINDYMKYVIKNNNSSIIYFHNFGRFDSTFIINWVAKNKKECGPIEIIERNNIIYEISLVKHKIRFRDSYLIIPLSLENIGETFCKKFKKDSFNYEDITNIYKEEKEKIISLCVNDCRILKEGFIEFSKMIKETFQIDIKQQLTLPSLAFNIFKHKYYNKNEHPITKNPYNEDSYIRRSYVGGISEVFKPELENGYCYDANSLYPFVMKKFKFPIGRGKMVKPDEINIENFIGFIECKVKINKELNFLTYRDPEKGLITPTGEWTSVYFAPEVRKAIKLGYRIEFISGFKYEKEGYIFKNYVEKIYEMRKNSVNKSMNSIAKLLLNSLYGRFGMKIFAESTKFITAREILELKKNNDIRNIHFIGNDLYTVSYIRKSKDSKELYKNSIDTNTAVQIASAVTSYARMYMYEFKNIKDNECYYTDTDSIFLKKKLDDKFIGNELGDFKLEYKIKKAMFIAPKVYYIKKEDNTEKITIKGLKKTEIVKEDIIKSFEKIINNQSVSIYIKRINNFKRDLIKLITKVEKMEIEMNFPFNKRVKIFDKGKWVNTRALKIKKI